MNADLARIFALVAGAQHLVGDGPVEFPIVGSAVRVRPDADVRLLQLGRARAAEEERSPTLNQMWWLLSEANTDSCLSSPTDDERPPVVEVVSGLGQADGVDAVAERDRLAQLEHGDVVVERLRVVLLVHRHRLQRDVLSACRVVVEIVFAGANSYLVNCEPE